MFGIGSTEFLVIILVALLVLGPRNLAKASRTVGRYVGEFRRISTDFQRTLNAEMAEEERQENRDAIRKKAEAAKAAREKRESGKKRTKRPVEADAQDQTAALETVQKTDAPEAMVCPPKGSPLEAALEKTAREAAETAAPAKSDTTDTAEKADTADTTDKTDDAATDGQGGRA